MNRRRVPWGPLAPVALLAGRRRCARPGRAVGAAAVAGVVLAGGVLVGTARPAAAWYPGGYPTTTTTQSYPTAGVYTITVPDYISEFTLDGLGAAGFPGDSTGMTSAGGKAGSGSRVHMVFSPGGDIGQSGHVLQVVVGAKGGGGWRGYGNEVGGSGGNGGGATYVVDQTSGALLMVAGGGGGGGGGGGAWPDYTGGAGGTFSHGTSGLGALGSAGSGGAAGTSGTCGSSGLSMGTPGESAPGGSDSGGGGGGGGGACGGAGGGSGEHRGGAGGGGGGGGAGLSLRTGTGTSGAGTNSGDGSATVTFTTYVPTMPQITSASCIGIESLRNLNFQLTASGFPIPVFGVNNAPSWVNILNRPEGFADMVHPLADSQEPPHGNYQFQVLAQNAVGVAVQNFTVAMGTRPGTALMFLSDPSATATADSPFSFPVRTVGCPPAASYRLLPGTPPVTWLRIDDTGRLYGTPPAGSAGVYTFPIYASPSDGSPDITQTFTLTVNPAPLAITTSSLPNGTAGSPSTVGSPYSTTLTASGGTSPYTWSLASGSNLPAGLTLNPDGTITGTPTTVGTTTVNVQVTDSASPPQTATQQLTLTVNPPPLAITTTGPLPAATVGSAYSASLAASGGTSPYTWSLPAGSSLPAGLTLNPDGTITGTPTTAGTVNPTVQVTDSGSPAQTATVQLRLTVNPPPLVVTTSSLPPGTVGSAYAATLTASGGTSPYTWSLPAGSSLPAGLTLNPDGTITGTPTTVGNSTVNVEVTDSGSPAQTATVQLRLTVNPPPPTVTAMTPHSGGMSSLVFIHGTNLTPPGTTCTLWSLRRCAVTVDFGTRAAFVLYASPTLIAAIAPPGTGTVDVTVTAAGRTSPTGPADRYTYTSRERGDDRRSPARER